MKNIKLRKLLIKLGISSNLKGFHYIIEAVKIIGKQEIHLNIMTIYEMVGKRYKNTPSAVERAIRHAIDKTYIETEALKDLYLHKPDNSVFLYDLVFNFDIFEDIIREKE